MPLILLAMVLTTVAQAGATDTGTKTGTAPDSTAPDSTTPDGTAPDNVAGQSLADCIAALNSKNRVRRLRAAHTIAVFGPTAAEQFAEMLTADDPAVRYLGAIHLGRFGGSTLQSNLPKLSQWVAQPSTDAGNPEPLAVRLAAAYAVCAGTSANDDGRDVAMSLLTKALSNPERGVSCTAADLLGRLGSKASAAIEPLEKTAAKNRPGVKGGDYHVGGAAMNALRKIRSGKNTSEKGRHL